MSSTPLESNSPQKSGTGVTPVVPTIWSRLRSAYQSGATPEGPRGEEELLPTFDTEPSDNDVPLAAPVPAEEIPAGILPEVAPVAEGEPPTDDEAPGIPLAQLAPPLAQPLQGRRCGFCGATRIGDSQYCLDCGLMFPPEPEGGVATMIAEMPAPGPQPPGKRLAGRYEIVECVRSRLGITRYRGRDHGLGGEPAPVVIVEKPRQAADSDPPMAEPVRDDATSEEDDVSVAPPADTERLTPGFIAEIAAAQWPGLVWERRLLDKASHRCLPQVLDQFSEADSDYLIEQAFEGESLWNSWDDTSVSVVRRYEWLAELAEAIKVLHDAGAIFEGLRPDIVVITPDGHPALTDLGDLLPLPLPPNPPIEATPYTAPELVVASPDADPRADLYGFGAMMYALFLGRELSDMDFERPGFPKPFVMRFPDVHPALARVIAKTFVRQTEARFPTDEAAKDDPTGFIELARTLRTLGWQLSHARLDIAAWTTTGMLRSGNEDAFALVHSIGSKQDDMGEYALIMLADGMGGYEAGEVASAMAIDSLRQQLLKEDMFAGLCGHPEPADGNFDVKGCRDLLVAALKETNRQIYTFSRTPGQGKRGMGCTAEALYVDSRRVIVGHVGDSRTYHYTNGRLVQLTRDQTLVNRLVELGHLRPDEAETHPRKNELQQAIGGQPDVDPHTYVAELKPGDWIVICSDGLTGHVNHADFTEMIQRADSAEMCARRLVNYANFQGGSDNTTVVAIRAT